MRKIYLLMLLLVVCTTVSAESLTCQYKEIVKTGKQISVLNVNGELKNNFLEAKNYNSNNWNQGGLWYVNAHFEVHNQLDIPVNVTVEFTSAGNTIKSLAEIQPHSFSNFGDTYSTGIDLNSVHYIYSSNDYSQATWIDEEIERCKICIGKDCLNDGSQCSAPGECGGDYCVRGLCSNSESCFNNDCKCSQDEVQCSDNKNCLKKNSVRDNVKTICNNPAECVSGYIDLETELCSKSPAQIQKEQDDKQKEDALRRDKQSALLTYAAVSLAFIILIGLGIFWYSKIKDKNKSIQLERDRKERIQKEMDLVITKFDGNNKHLKELDEKIIEFKNKKILLEEENEAYKELLKERGGVKEQIDNTTDEIKNAVRKQWKARCTPVPEPLVGNQPVFVNPFLGGYLCFYRKGVSINEHPTSTLIHRWIWKKHNGRWPRPGYHIHHIDGDKYNNHPSNLKEIKGEEHFEMHRSQ